MFQGVQVLAPLAKKVETQYTQAKRMEMKVVHKDYMLSCLEPNDVQHINFGIVKEPIAYDDMMDARVESFFEENLIHDMTNDDLLEIVLAAMRVWYKVITMSMHVEEVDSSKYKVVVNTERSYDDMHMEDSIFEDLDANEDNME